MKDTTHTLNVDLDWGRIREALSKHSLDILAAIAAIDRIQTWFTPQEIAGSTTVCNLGGTMDPTGVGTGQSQWANAFAILQQAGHPLSVAEIATIMRKSGVVTKSADFESTLNSILSKRQDIFRRIKPRVWWLVEHEPIPRTTVLERLAAHAHATHADNDSAGNVSPVSFVPGPKAGR